MPAGGGARPAAVAVGLVAGWWTGWPVAVGLAAAGVWWLPRLLGPDREHEQAVARIEAVAGWAEQLRDTLAAASGLEQALTVTARTAPGPVRPVVAGLAARIGAGERLPTALARAGVELADPTADLVIAALTMAAGQQARQLAELLAALAGAARAEAAGRLRIAVARARVRTAVRVTVGATLALAAVLVAFDAPYLQLYESVTGQLVLVGIGGLFAAAFGWLRRIARPPTAHRLASRSREPAMTAFMNIAPDAASSARALALWAAGPEGLAGPAGVGGDRPGRGRARRRGVAGDRRAAAGSAAVGRCGYGASAPGPPRCVESRRAGPQRLGRVGVAVGGVGGAVVGAGGVSRGPGPGGSAGGRAAGDGAGRRHGRLGAGRVVGAGAGVAAARGGGGGVAAGMGVAGRRRLGRRGARGPGAGAGAAAARGAAPRGRGGAGPDRDRVGGWGRGRTGPARRRADRHRLGP